MGSSTGATGANTIAIDAVKAAIEKSNDHSSSGEELAKLSAEDISNNPKILRGKSKEEISKILGDEWTEGTYGTSKNGWKFTKGDQIVFYHPGGGRHVGSYHGYSSGKTGKIKIVGSDYVPLPGDKAKIISD